MKPQHPLLFAAGKALTLNAEALPEWIQLAPFGDHPTRDKKRVQVFNSEAAKQVIQWFNFFPRRLGRLMGLNATPVWIGHPDFDPETWPQRTQIGNVAELEERADGLYGRITWNADAPAALRDQGHKFPSVAWDCDEGEGNQLHPAMLWSVGMWRTPNIKSVQPVINADDADTETETQPETTMLNKILNALREAGIIKEGDSEDGVLASIGNMISSLAYSREEKARRAEETSRLRAVLNAGDDTTEDTLVDEVLVEINTARTELEKNTARITELEGMITTLNAARVEDELTRLIETGRVSKADEETLRAELNADFAAAREKYAARQIQLNSKPLDIGRHKPAVMETNARMNKLLDWINTRMATTNYSFDEA